MLARATQQLGQVRIPIWTSLVVATAILAQLWPGDGSALVYDRERILAGELWRAVTGHWVHFSWEHLSLNVLAFFLAGSLIERRAEPLFGLLCVASPIAISIALLRLQPDMSVYAGLSGMVSGAVMYLGLRGIAERGGWRWACIGLLLGIGVKLWLELHSRETLFVGFEGVPVGAAPLAHAAGALSGAGVWLLSVTGPSAIRAALAVGIAAGFLGCFSLRQAGHEASSVVDFLYGGRVGKVEQPKVPLLRLPLKVGIAFVPPEFRPGSAPISEVERLELTDRIAASFQALEFVESIESIPATALQPQGGFANLDQLRTRFGIDVIGLLSYDQVQFTGVGLASISYWTLVGAYLVEGEKNDTHTMLDAAVYDIASRTLLFRAPGISQIKGRSTPIELAEELRRDRERGFEEAVTDLIANLHAELESFREEVKRERAKVRVLYE